MLANFSRFVPAAASLALALSLSTSVQAEVLVDRGLPTANLNNAAGANRSNVAWAFSQYTSNDYWMVGDTFTNTTSATWQITGIRLWTVGTTTSAVLRGAVAGEDVGVVSGTTYADLSTYQGYLGGSTPMYQVDFTVDIVLGAGETYQFFLDGSGSAGTGQGTSIPFLHASNALRSGSPQQGSDDLMLAANVVDGDVLSASIETWTSAGFGWDKASDVNVQVFGNAVPEPGSLALFAVALTGLAVGARRRRAQG